MAVKKPTTTSDVTTSEDVAPPTLEQMVARVEEHTDPAVVAEVKEPKYVTVTSPLGAKTEVPAELADVLKDSGYKTGK